MNDFRVLGIPVVVQLILSCSSRPFQVRDGPSLNVGPQRKLEARSLNPAAKTPRQDPNPKKQSQNLAQFCGATVTSTSEPSLTSKAARCRDSGWKMAESKILNCILQCWEFLIVSKCLRPSSLAPAPLGPRPGDGVVVMVGMVVVEWWSWRWWQK